MKKRMLGILMTLVMVIGMIPTVAFAAECDNNTDACIEAVQELVDTLPDMTEIDAENREEVIAILEAIDEAKLHLTDAEREEVNWTKYSDAAFVLCTPTGWFGFCVEKRYEVAGDNPAPKVSFINEDGKAEAMVSAATMASMTETELEPNGTGKYFYLPEGEYDVLEEVDGEWDMTLSVNGEEEDSFEGIAGRAYRLVLGNSSAPEQEPEVTDYLIWVEGVQVTSENADNILGDHTVSYANGVLTLKNADIKYPGEEEGYPEGIYADGDLNIKLEGQNQISVKGEAEVGPAMGIMASGDLKIVGDDKKEDALKVNVSEVADEDNTKAAAIGIVSAGSVSIDGVTVGVTTEVGGAYVCGTGILALNGLVIGEEDSADVNVTANVTGAPIFMGSSPAAEMEFFGLESVQQKASMNESTVSMLLISAVGAYEVAVLEGCTLAVQAKDDVFGMTARGLYVDKGTDVTISADPAENETAALVLGYEPMVNPEKVLYANGEAWDYESVANMMSGMVAVCENGKGEILEVCSEDDSEGPVFATDITFEDALKLTVEADRKTVKPGDEVLFTITLENMMCEGKDWELCALYEEDFYEYYERWFEYGHEIGREFPGILVKNILNDDQFDADGYFCDADGNQIESIYEIEVDDVIPVMNTDIKGLEFDEDGYDKYGRYVEDQAILFGGEKAILYYKAVVSKDAEEGKAESTTEVRTVIGSREETGEISLMSAEESGEEDITFKRVFEDLDKDDKVLLLNPTATVSVTVKAEKESSGGGSRYPDVEVMTEGGDVGVGKKLVIIRPDAGYEIDKVTVNGKEVEVPENGKLTGLRSSDDVKIWFAEKVSAVEQKEIILMINELVAFVFDKYVTNDVAPVIRGGRTMLPARFVVEALGGAVAWDEAAQKVTITKEGAVLEIFIGERFATVNGEPVELDAPAFIENDRTYLPIRFVAEYLGANVVWNADAQSVIIIPGE